jgi:glycine cleavage system H protein
VVTLIFVAVLLAAVFLDFLIIRPWEARHLPKPATNADDGLEFAVPRAVFFHPGHTWARVDNDGRVAVGVDDLARTVIGDLSTVELPAVGERVTAGRPAVVIHQGERRLRLAAPLSGTVVETNDELGRDPNRLRWRPYKEGWMYRLEPEEGFARELGSLAIGRDAAAWMGREIEDLRRSFEEGRFTAPVEGALVRGNHEAWSAFERDFLGTTGKPGEVGA